MNIFKARFNPGLNNEELSGVEMFMIEKFGVVMFMVEKFMAKIFMVEKFLVEVSIHN